MVVLLFGICTFLNLQKMIKVSVVVPIYNVERYLDESLGSVVNQTLR